MDKEFYDKYGKELDCKSCIGLQECSTNSNIPLCDKGYIRFAKDKIADLETELVEKDKEIESLTNRTNRYENMFRSRINRTGDIQKDIELYVKQLAIQELEKVKNYICDYSEITGQAWSHTLRFLNNRINESKGE